MLSGTLLYLIPPGLVRIGKRSENTETIKKVPLDIVLDGPLVKKLHWLVLDFQGRFPRQLRRSSSTPFFEASRFTTSRNILLLATFAFWILLMNIMLSSFPYADTSSSQPSRNHMSFHWVQACLSFYHILLMHDYILVTSLTCFYNYRFFTTCSNNECQRKIYNADKINISKKYYFFAIYVNLHPSQVFLRRCFFFFLFFICKRSLGFFNWLTNDWWLILLKLYIILIINWFFSFVFLFNSTIENKNGKLMLLPEMDGDTYVNGQVIWKYNNYFCV